MPRLLVVGGDAGGMTAAATVRRRLGEAVDVVVLERGGWTSYSACGIPYWIAGDIGSPDDLVARTPAEHRRRGIDVRLGWEAIALDPAARTVIARRPDGREIHEGYDALVLATGARPRRPPVPGHDAEGIVGIKTLDDGVAFLDRLTEQVGEVVIVGSGYIGIEMAEACVRRGLSTTVVDRNDVPLKLLDADLGDRVAASMRQAGVRLVLGTDVEAFETEAGRVRAVVTADGRFDADLVIAATGVDPASDLAAAAGLPLGAAGAIRTDEQMAAGDGIWAAGDCVDAVHRITAERVYLPLGTHANKQGLVAGSAIAHRFGASEPAIRFEGVLGTAITKFCDLQIARTGLTVAQAEASGLEPVAVTIDSTTRASYMPGAAPITVRLVADRGSRRLLGGQIVGGEGAAKRIDTIATALWAGLDVDTLVMADLAYAPPFSPVWDPVQTAARAVTAALRSRASVTTSGSS